MFLKTNKQISIPEYTQKILFKIQNQILVPELKFNNVFNHYKLDNRVSILFFKLIHA